MSREITWTAVAAIVAASAAGVLTEWSVSKTSDSVTVVGKTQESCTPQMTTVPYELRGYYLRFRPWQRT